MTEKNKESLSAKFEKHKQDEELLIKKFDRLWKNMKPLIVETLKVETDLIELYKNQIREHLINPEDFDSGIVPTIGIQKEDGTFEFVLPEVNEKTIIEAAKNFRDQIEEHFEANIEPAEELEKIPHILTLLYELGILEVINQRFKGTAKVNKVDKARLIGTIIGKTDEKSVKNISKNLSYIDFKASAKNPINEISIKEVTKVLIEYGLQIEKLDSFTPATSKKPNPTGTTGK